MLGRNQSLILISYNQALKHINGGEGGIIRPSAQAEALTPSGPSPTRGDVVSALIRNVFRFRASAQTWRVLLVPRHSANKRGPWWAPFIGGEGGIRTHGTVARTLDFESSPFGQLRHLSKSVEGGILLGIAPDANEWLPV